MFKLTKQERLIVGFVMAALVVGSVVKEWRARRELPPPSPPAAALQVRD